MAELGQGFNSTGPWRMDVNGTLTTIVDEDGNVEADITTVDLTTTGTTTLGDAGDATQVNGTLTVGEDDTGYDFKVFGATASKYLVWDESADSLKLTDSTPLQLGGDEATADGFTLSFDGDAALEVDALTANDTIEVGKTTSTDFNFNTAGGTITVDASEDTLTLSGASLVIGNVGATTETANTLVPVMFTAATEVIAAGNPGAISVATYCTHISVDAGGDAFTLAAGTVVGQRKRIYFLATAGGTGVVTGAFRGASNTLTFTNAGEYAELIWDGTDWLDIELGSTDDTNIATPPALSTV